MNELQTFESVNDEKSGEANVAKDSSDHNKKKKKNAGKNKGKFKRNGNPRKNANSKKSGKGQKGNCFHCDKPGHWKRNCKQYLEEMKDKKKGKGKYNILVLETCLVESDILTWVIDLGATNHV